MVIFDITNIFAKQMPVVARAAIHLISLGFLSHLTADVQTPRGLPGLRRRLGLVVEMMTLF
jgi:hypothetical protein